MEPTELQSRTAVERALETLTQAALAAGITMRPRWDISWAPTLGYCLVAGHFHSDDDSALLALECWSRLIGEDTFHSHTFESPVLGHGVRRSWRVETQVAGSSVWIMAIVPTAVQATATSTGIAVAA